MINRVETLAVRALLFLLALTFTSILRPLDLVNPKREATEEREAKRGRWRERERGGEREGERERNRGGWGRGREPFIPYLHPRT